MSNSQKQQEYVSLLMEKVQKGDITPEEKQTINEYKRDVRKSVLIRAIPSSVAMYAFYVYRNKGARISFLKTTLCGAGGLLFGIIFTPGKAMWNSALERNHITQQHVLGKIALIQDGNFTALNELIEQDLGSMKASRPARTKPAFVTGVRQDNTVGSEFDNKKNNSPSDSDLQTNDSLSFFTGGANQGQSEQATDEPESLMEKRLRRNRRNRAKPGEEGNSSDGNTNSGRKVNQYGDPIE